MTEIVKPENYSNLLTDLGSLIEQGRKTAARYVNTALVATYWLMGRRIVEHEQQGKERAEYGEALLGRLSADLIKQFGKGWGEPNLRAIRQFYLIYKDIEKRYTVCSESGKSAEMEIRHTPCSELAPTISQMLSSELFSKLFPLTWSHYRLLMRLDEPFKREFYEAECISGNWSVRQLDRQIQSMLYERTALSKRKLAVIAKAHENPITLTPEDEIKDPYILEFLGLKDEYSESQLEEALIRHLEHFLLELGRGFTFTNKTVVEYALGGMNNKIFTSQYAVQLPDPDILRAEIERERQRFLGGKSIG